DEVVHVHDPVLEQVAEAAATVGEELGRVRMLDILRHDEHRGVGRARAQRQRSADAVVAERGRKPHVDDGDVRLLEQDGGDERVAICDRGDDVETVVAKQAREAVAQEREVLRDHDAHGITARIVVGPPAGLVTASVPSSASTRRASPRRPLPSAFAPPAPSSTTSATSAPSSSRTSTVTCRACACLPAFASASTMTKYAAVSTARGGRRGTSTVTSTRSGVRSAIAEIAASRPRAVSR